MSETKHPADMIGKELLRAGGIVSSLTNCYDRQAGLFDVGPGLLFEALCNVERMLNQAGEALQVLFENHDLRSFEEIKTAASADAVRAPMGSTDSKADISDASQGDNRTIGEANELKNGPAILSDEVIVDELSSQIGSPMPFVDYLQTSVSAARLSDRLDAILERFPREEPRRKSAEPIDAVAKTYTEFLDKLTAMADAAAGEALRAGKKELALAPVLESLREDVKRLRSVA